VSPSGQKLTLYLLALFPGILTFFLKCILQVVFSIARDSSSIASVVSKGRPLRFSSVGETVKSWVGGDSRAVFGKKFPGEKEV
jgi:hypothetical protein